MHSVSVFAYVCVLQLSLDRDLPAGAVYWDCPASSSPESGQVTMVTTSSSSSSSSSSSVLHIISEASLAQMAGVCVYCNTLGGRKFKQ